MSPLNRLSRRSEAFSILGVPSSATREDVRRAYRKLAFEKHPDQHPECGSEFARITEAYQFVCNHADELGLRSEPAQPEEAATPVSPRRVSRPSLQATETEFDAQAMAECKAVLSGDDDCARHVASAIYRVGRSLTYFVPTGVVKGANEVAVPTGMLHDSRRVLPQVLHFHSNDVTAGCFEMSRELCNEYFPGAREVRIRFASV